MHESYIFIERVVFFKEGREGRKYGLKSKIHIAEGFEILSVYISFQGPAEFTETLNRITITTLAIIIKTRGIAEAEQVLYLPTMVEQILATSQHTWSEKTLRYFPPILRDALSGRIDKRGLAIQAWQQVTKMLHFDLNFMESASFMLVPMPLGWFTFPVFAFVIVRIY